MTIAQAATHFEVSEEYVRRRVAEAGLTRRPGTFAPRSAWSPEVLQARAGKLYEKGMTMREVGARLGVSSTTVSMVRYGLIRHRYLTATIVDTAGLLAILEGPRNSATSAR
jgi:transposase